MTSHYPQTGHSSGVDLMKVSTTSSQTDETNVSQSTVITVRLYGNHNETGTSGYGGHVRRTRSEPVATSTSVHTAAASAETTKNQETLITDVVVVRHPRSVLILAVLELIIGLQMLVIGTICVIYNGPIYASGLWAGWPFVLQGILGVLMVKKYPIRRFIVLYLIVTIICLLIALCLFGITWHELRLQEERMRLDGWDYLRQSTLELNKIVESTKAGVFIVQLVLLAAHAAASIVSLILCIINVRQPSKELRRAFYIADDQFGHQLVLVPVKLRTGADIDTWLDEAAAAASSAALGGVGGGGLQSAGSGNRLSYPSAYNTISTFPYYGQPPHMLHHSLNGSMSSALKTSKAVQTNVTFGQ